jgi:N-acetylmuramoyl-L-alanine amidase CwlA
MAKNYGVNGLGTKQNLKYQSLLQTDPDAAARYLSSMQAQNNKTGIIPSVTQTSTTQQKTDTNNLVTPPPAGG